MIMRLPADAGGQETLEEFAVYLNSSPDRRVLMLLFPHRGHSRETRTSYAQRPRKVRIKPSAGLVEVDIPLYTNVDYDPDRAAKFAQALKQSKTIQAGGDHGLAGGFGANAAGRSAREPQRHDAGDGMDMDGGDREKLAYQTLGGRMQIFTDHDAPYMIGVFQEGEQPSERAHRSSSR